jgi:death-on-curing protein
VSWRWLGEGVLLAVHEQQIAEHGGSPGIRDRGLLESALAQPQNKPAYGAVDAAALAAAYAWGIARNHPFIDGNKRVALLAAEILGNKYPEIRAAVKRHREAQARTILEHPDPRDGS